MLVTQQMCRTEQNSVATAPEVGKALRPRRVPGAGGELAGVPWGEANRSCPVQNVLAVSTVNKNETRGRARPASARVCTGWGKYTASLSPSESKGADDANRAHVTRRSVA